MNRNLNRRPVASTREPKTNGGDKVVRTLRVYESGRVVPLPGRPPKSWQQVIARAAAHALPSDGPATAPAEVRQEPAPAKVKDPRKVAAGKARAAQAKAAREAAGKTAAAPAPAKKAAAKRAPAKAASKPKAKPAAKAKAKPAKTPAKRGGARPGSGPKPASGDAMVVAAFRVTKAQKKKLGKLGAEWLRARIDAATVK
jgi:hypothetical protein